MTDIERQKMIKQIKKLFPKAFFEILGTFFIALPIITIGLSLTLSVCYIGLLVSKLPNKIPLIMIFLLSLPFSFRFGQWLLDIANKKD